MKYSVLAAFLGMASAEGICISDEFEYVPGCECHDTCGTACGYYDWPDANDDCIDCKPGRTLNAIYSDGTGYCVEDSHVADTGCFDGNMNKIEGCECHESCGVGGSCGYYSWPTDYDDCINCPAGSTLYAIYSDGTGYCEDDLELMNSTSMAAPPDDDDDEFEEEDFLLKDLEKSLTKLLVKQVVMAAPPDDDE